MNALRISGEAVNEELGMCHNVDYPYNYYCNVHTRYI